MTNEMINAAAQVAEQAMQWPEAIMWAIVAVSVSTAVAVVFKYS